MIETNRQFPLAFPVEVDGTRYETVTLHRARARDLRDIAVLRRSLGEVEQDGFDLMIQTLAVLARVPAAVIEEMDGQDFNDLSEVVEDFLPGSGSISTTTPGAGEASSPTAPSS
jgi:hypothetical protein